MNTAHGKWSNLMAHSGHRRRKGEPDDTGLVMLSGWKMLHGMEDKGECRWCGNWLCCWVRFKAVGGYDLMPLLMRNDIEPRLLNGASPGFALDWLGVDIPLVVCLIGFKMEHQSPSSRITAITFLDSLVLCYTRYPSSFLVAKSVLSNTSVSKHLHLW